MPRATRASIRRSKGRQSGRGLVWMLGSWLVVSWLVGSWLVAVFWSASGLAVVVFMAPACCREPGPAIGKTPGSTLMIRRPDQGLPGWPPAPIWRDDGGMEERTGWLGYRYRCRGPLGWVRGPRGSGPLRRGKGDRLAGGVAAGLAPRLGLGRDVVRLLVTRAR